ncbi:MAG: DUF3253 domain-containing protein, partial [Myxococcota bacterium]
PFEWRKKWADQWESVRYCSAACRKARVSARDRDLAETLLALLEARGPHKSLCPSEVARQAGGEEWRARMSDVRAIAARYERHGVLQATQRGEVVALSDARGPIRLRLRRGR